MNWAAQSSASAAHGLKLILRASGIDASLLLLRSKRK